MIKKSYRLEDQMVLDRVVNFSMKTNIDFHLLLASKILHISYEEASTKLDNAKKRNIDTATKEELSEDKTIKDARQWAKRYNFGYPAGLGSDLICTEKEK